MKNLAKFLLKAGNLKKVHRSGWVREEMPEPETVAEHSWRLAFLAMLLEDKLDTVNINKLLRMALIHDLTEALTGDIVIQRGAKQINDKNIDEEEKTIKEMVSGIKNGNKVFRLWEEQAAENSIGATREANILYQLGKIATAWQALEYELTGADPKKLDEFWENAHAHVKEPIIGKLLEELESLRKK